MDPAEKDDTSAHGCASKRSHPGVVGIENPQKTSHADPPEDAHGLCLANPCRVGFVGGVGSGKTTTLLNILARCSEWKPFDACMCGRVRAAANMCCKVGGCACVEGCMRVIRLYIWM